MIGPFRTGVPAPVVRPSLHRFATVVTGIAVVVTSCLLPACAPNPRREVREVDGERYVTIRAPQITAEGPNGPRLTRFAEIDGSSLPFEPGFWQSRDVSADEKGRLFVCDGGHGHIVIIDYEGRFHGTVGTRGPGPFEFDSGSLSPSVAEWVEAGEVLAVRAGIMKVLFFQNGWQVRSGRLEGRWLGRLPMAATPDGIVLINLQEKIFLEYSTDGDSLRAYGRPFSPADARWPEVADYLQRHDFNRSSERVRLATERAPWYLGVAADSLLVHEVSYRNSYRFWNRHTGRFAFQVDLESGDVPPPSLYTYEAGGITNMMSWRGGGPPEVANNHFVMALRWRHGLFFALSYVRGDASNSKPDSRVLSSPMEAANELTEGKPYRMVLEVLTLDPDLLAHLVMEIPTYPVAGEVGTGPVVILAFDDPLPHLALYRVDGLPLPEAATMPGSQ